jgi:hypothetical protein
VFFDPDAARVMLADVTPPTGSRSAAAGLLPRAQAPKKRPSNGAGPSGSPKKRQSPTKVPFPNITFIISDQQDKQIRCGNLPGKKNNEIRSSFLIETIFFSFFIFTCVEFFPTYKILQNDVNSFSGYISFLFIHPTMSFILDIN